MNIPLIFKNTLGFFNCLTFIIKKCTQLKEFYRKMMVHIITPITVGVKSIKCPNTPRKGWRYIKKLMLKRDNIFGQLRAEITLRKSIK